MWKRFGLTLALGCMAGTAVAAGIEGTWILVVETPRGVQHPQLRVIGEGDAYHGTYTGRQGELPIERIEVDGDAFSFPLRVTMPMGEMDLRYSGLINGDHLEGEIGNPRGSIPFTGTRAE